MISIGLKDNKAAADNFNKLSVGISKRTEIKSAAAELDKYYTKPEIANKCYAVLTEVLPRLNVKEYTLIEPSAGSGVFLKAAREKNIIGFDIAPNPDDDLNIVTHDFLNEDLTKKIDRKLTRSKRVFIGNPPFGNKSELAIAFINRALSYGNVVGFILPIQFRKWSAQSKLNSKAKLILDVDLPECAFEIMGQDYKLRCCFQVWTLIDSQMPDLRISSKPPVAHPDFEAYQYNRTEAAEKFFDYEWDFAVPRQGFQNYTVKAFSKIECDKKQQWIFFKAKNEAVLERLLSLDFVKLSRKNIGTPGFGKADVVGEYVEQYEKNNKKVAYGQKNNNKK